MSKKSFIDSVEVKSPCSEDWEKMHGNDRVRFCDHCAKDVKNLSAVTRKEAMRMVRSSGGNLCIRYVKDPVTNRPLFADQLFQITRRAPGLAAGVMSASLSLASMTYAQSESTTSMPVQAVVRTDEKKSSEPLNTNENVKTDAKASATAKISGTVVDPNGAVIQNAKVTIFSVAAGKTAETTTNDEGIYKFDNLSPGTYRIESEAGGFMRNIREVVVSDAEETVTDASLGIGLEATVDVVADVTLQVGQAMGGVMVSVEYSSPLAKAVSNEDIEEVRAILIKGENVNGKDDNYGKITPLFIAVENGNVEITRLLLDFGAKVNARDRSNQTPLMRLDEDATPEFVKLLLDHDIKVDLTDNEGNTALILVAGNVKPEVLSALIDAGADVNHANNEGQTALMNAANRDILESVRMLLQAGARLNAKNKEGDTAWGLASDDDVKSLLVSFGAEVKETTPDTPGSDPQ